MSPEPFHSDQMVKTCSKLESGLFLGIDGLRPCSRGALAPPALCSVEELVTGKVDLELVVARRKKAVEMLNDDHSEMDCKRCLLVEHKRYGDIEFSRVGHVDLQHYSTCNLRCQYCRYTREDLHLAPQYDALGVLRLFSPQDVLWNAHVDFAGGEPTLLPNLEEYLDFFKSLRIRVLMHTNAVIFHQAIYDGLADGSLYWATVSLDAGTPSTYQRLRGGDHYLQVMENLSRYAVAGSRGKGMLSVKYIFCEANCGDDDLAAFAYAMLALRPQKVWLTFDFTPLSRRQVDFDYSRQSEAYAKLYLLLKKHGMEPFHYFKEAVASVSQEARKIMDQVFAAIERLSPGPVEDADLLFTDFRNGDSGEIGEVDAFSVSPLRIRTVAGETEAFSVAGKRVLLVPACPLSQQVSSDPEVGKAAWIGFVDRNPVQQGKSIEGRTIYSYEEIEELKADVILVMPLEKHRRDILRAVMRNATASMRVAEFVS